MSRLRVATVSTFFPNASAPYRTLFVRHLVTAMAQQVQMHVLAPLTYAPPWPRRPRWQALRRVGRVEQQGTLEVEHPRYLVIPKLWSLSGFSYSLSVAAPLKRLVRAGSLDVVHVHCAYPDAVGVARIARNLGVPFVITAHGSDINVYSKRASLRAQVRKALLAAAAVIAVSEDLRAKIRLLVPEIADRIECIPCCGVTPSIFHVGSREAARTTLGVPAASRVALFVGNLVPIKGVDTLISAWRLLLGAGTIGAQDRLVMIGDGPLRSAVESAAREPDMRGTIQVLGPRPQPEIASWMQAANLLCLSSRHEGMPNVVVEALASGLPVVATAVGGVPELVKGGENGLLVPAADPRAFADALAAAFARKWDTDQIALTVRGYNWENLAGRNLDVLARAVQRATTR